MSKITEKRRKSFTVKGKTSLYYYLALLVIVPLILNWKVISYEFTTSDDTTIIENNYGFLSDLNNVFKAFEKDNFLSKEGIGYYRPVQTVSFMIDTQVGNGKANVYHFSNLFYHILTVIVFFLLLRKLWVRDDISFFISLLFSVHPLLTDAIAWIPGRGDLLSGLFCSLSFLIFIHYNNTKNKWYFIIHSLTFALAMFSKEISVFLPVVIVYYYCVVLKNRLKIRMLVPFIVVWILTVLLFFLLRHLFLNYQDLLSFKALIRSLPVIPIFISKLIIPLGLSPMPVYNVLYTVTGIIIFILSGIYIWKLKTGNKSLIILGILWFLGFIIPALFADLIFTEVHFDYLECRSYLPAIGIFITLGVLLSEINKGKEINILMGYFIPVIVIFSFITYRYSGDFADGMTFYSSLINSNPKDAYSLNERGCWYLKEKTFDLALADFDNSIRTSPIFSDPYNNKGLLYMSLGDHTKAEKFLALALNYDTLYPKAKNDNTYLNLSSEKLNLKKYEEAIVIIKKGIGKYPDDKSLHNNLGLAYYYTSKFDSAVVEYNKAIQPESNSFRYYNNRGKAEFRLERLTDAMNDFNRALELKPDFMDAYFYRGLTKMNLNKFEESISDFNMTISLDSRSGEAYYFRGVAYSKLNKRAEADKDWEEARKHGFKEPMGE